MGQAYLEFRDELARVVIAPVLAKDMATETSGVIQQRALDLLDRKMAHLSARIHRVGPDPDRDETRAEDALGKLRGAILRFNASAESLREARRKDRAAGRFDVGGPNELGVSTLYFFTSRLMEAGPSASVPIEPLHRWNAARHAIAKYKRHPDARALLVLDIDRPGLLGDPREKESPVKAMPVHPPHLSIRHLAMVSFLAGNHPALSAPRTVYQILKGEMSAIRKQLSIWKVTDRPRAVRPDLPKKRNPTKPASSQRAPSHRRIPVPE